MISKYKVDQDQFLVCIYDHECIKYNGCKMNWCLGERRENGGVKIYIPAEVFYGKKRKDNNQDLCREVWNGCCWHVRVLLIILKVELKEHVSSLQWRQTTTNTKEHKKVLTCGWCAPPPTAMMLVSLVVDALCLMRSPAQEVCTIHAYLGQFWPRKKGIGVSCAHHALSHNHTQNNNASTRLPSYLSYFEVWPVRARVPSRRAHCVWQRALPFLACEHAVRSRLRWNLYLFWARGEH